MRDKMARSKKRRPAAIQSAQATEQLIADLFEDNSHPLREPLRHWITSSKRFAAFVEFNHNKIRSKLKIHRDVEAAQDLQCELASAYWLLQTPKFEVAYEPYKSQAGRGTDFAVVFRTHTVFNVEVTRLRTPPPGQPHRPDRREPNPGTDRTYDHRRFVDMLCDKLGQLLPSMSNVLSVWADSRTIHNLDVEQITAALKGRIEARDPEVLQRYGYRNPADFFRLYQRLSAIWLLKLQPELDGVHPLLWINRQARHPLTTPLRTMLQK